MNFKENVLLALTGLKANKMRAFLTMLGIIIGISSVIMITTMGSIVEKGLAGVITDLGVNNLMEIYLYRKEDASRNWVESDDMLNDEKVKIIMNRFADDIDYVVFKESVGEGKMRHKREEVNMTVIGYNPEYLKMLNSELINGRYLTEKDLYAEKSVCVIPDELAKKLYGKTENAVGKTLPITIMDSEKEFGIIGVYKYKQSAFGGVYSANYDIHIPLTTARRMNNSPAVYDYVDFFANEGIDVTVLSKKIMQYVNETFYKDNDTFEVSSYSMVDELASINKYIVIVQVVLSIIAGISLLVGGIGVMNIMLVSVTERTREIGVRKALGAPNSAIRIQFIVESIIICAIGGCIGIISGILLGNLGGLLLKVTAVPSISAIIIAVTFSMAIGVFFGYYPANRAAKLDPIEALRYE